MAMKGGGSGIMGNALWVDGHVEAKPLNVIMPYADNANNWFIVELRFDRNRESDRRGDLAC